MQQRLIECPCLHRNSKRQRGDVRVKRSVKNSQEVFLLTLKKRLNKTGLTWSRLKWPEMSAF
jgi:hypothetical protein